MLTTDFAVDGGKSRKFVALELLAQGAVNIAQSRPQLTQVCDQARTRTTTLNPYSFDILRNGKKKSNCAKDEHRSCSVHEVAGFKGCWS